MVTQRRYQDDHEDVLHDLGKPLTAADFLPIAVAERTRSVHFTYLHAFLASVASKLRRIHLVSSKERGEILAGLTGHEYAAVGKRHVDRLRGQGQRTLNICSVRTSVRKSVFIMHRIIFAAEAVLDGMTLQKRHREASQPTQVVAQCALAGAAVVLAEVHVQHPVHRLDAPVAAHRFAEPLAAEITAENVVPRLVGLTAVGVLRHPQGVANGLDPGPLLLDAKSGGTLVR